MPKVPLPATTGRKLESRMEEGRARLTCEEWMARIRKSGPELVTVEDFHRECLRIAAKLQATRDSSGVLFLSPGETDAP